MLDTVYERAFANRHRESLSRSVFIVDFGGRLLWLIVSNVCMFLPALSLSVHQLLFCFVRSFRTRLAHLTFAHETLYGPLSSITNMIIISFVDIFKHKTQHEHRFVSMKFMHTSEIGRCSIRLFTWNFQCSNGLHCIQAI